MYDPMTLAELIHSGIVTFICALIPFIGMHGAVVFAAAMRVDWLAAFLLASAGAIVSIALTMQVPRETIERLRRWHIFDLLFDRVDGYIARHKEGIEQHAYRTLVLIVAVPFTGIGGLTACALAKLLDLEDRRATAALAVGTAIQCLITTATVYGLLTGLRTLLGVFG